jgi:3-dehydroquinate synthase
MLPDHIVIQSGPEALLKTFLSSQSFTKVAVIADEHTLLHCYPLLEKALPRHEMIVIPAGEEHKNLDTCILIWQKLTDLAFDRSSLLLGLGGGVVGDMGGFCAATFKRGIHFLLMPTTLLAQADASIGGKTGIDFQYYKNQIGVFQEPIAILMATDFLKTLPLLELRSGFAEVIKHSMISDQVMWEEISARSFNEQNWAALILHSASFKYSIVKKDPTEKGLRKILNFGHTLGHALESYLLGKGNRIFHGEAVAVGMIAESFIANQKGLLNAPDLERISRYIISVFSKIQLPTYRELIPIILQDKKNRGAKILMALPKGIGSAVWDIPVSEEEIKASLEYYSSR